MMNVFAVLCVLVAFFVGVDATRDSRVMTFKINCYDAPIVTTAEMQKLEGRRTLRHVEQKRIKSEDIIPTEASLHTKGLKRRQDRLSREQEDVVREHAKLVQDINGLSHVIFYAPQVDNPMDYEDSIHHEIIETYTTTTTTTTTATAKPVTTTFRKQISTHAKPTGLPVILVGGTTKNSPIRIPPLVKSKQIINLVGSSSSPKIVTKTPYSFIGKKTMMPPYSFVTKATATPIPLKICMPMLPVHTLLATNF